MDRIQLNRWLIALITFAMLVLVYEPDEKIAHIEIDSEHPEADYTMENVTITEYTINGVQNHQLTAKKMIHYNKKEELTVERDEESEQMLNNESSRLNNSQSKEQKTLLNSEVSILVEPVISYKNQQSLWTLSAKKGRMTNQQTKLFLTNDVKLVEQVELIEQSGEIKQVDRKNTSTAVTTNDLEIDLISKIAHTEQKVKLTAQNIIASSQGMKIDMRKSKIYLLSNVHSQLQQIKK